MRVFTIALLGTFASKPLRVISKPSKKKQSVKTNPDMCMEDGCEIVLFNRMRTAAVRASKLVGCRLIALVEFVTACHGLSSSLCVRPLRGTYGLRTRACCTTLPKAGTHSV